MRYVITGLLALLWSSMTWLYVQSHIQQVEAPTPLTARPRGWYYYLMFDKEGQLVGHSAALYSPQEDRGLLITHRAKWLLASWMPFVSQISSSPLDIRLYAYLDREMKPLSFQLRWKLKVQHEWKQWKLEGQRRGEELHLTFHWQGQKWRQKMKADSLFLGESLGFWKIAKGQEGSRWLLSSPLGGKVYQFRLKRKGKYTFRGEELEAYLIEVKIHNSPTPPWKVWVDERGMAFEVHFPDKKRMLRVSYAEYRKWKKRLPSEKKKE